jgi:transcriptional regulator with XRE-family HTH domain
MNKSRLSVNPCAFASYMLYYVYMFIRSFQSGQGALRMARTRPGLELAVLDILRRHGVDGKRMSLRQAERMTGLSPATVGELAKGNARTPETILRFANGLGEDADRLLLLAGFVPDESMRRSAMAPAHAQIENDIGGDEREWLGRFGRALAKMPPGRERDLWKDSLRRDTELIESFLARFSPNETNEP